MFDVALRTLQSRSLYLRLKLEGGTAADIAQAREKLRLSLVELHRLGYWRERPERLREHMRLFRSCRCLDISGPPSRSGPDRTGRYSP